MLFALIVLSIAVYCTYMYLNGPGIEGRERTPQRIFKGIRRDLPKTKQKEKLVC